jgi:hypothetical protein
MLALQAFTTYLSVEIYLAPGGASAKEGTVCGHADVSSVEQASANLKTE